MEYSREKHKDVKMMRIYANALGTYCTRSQVEGASHLETDLFNKVS